MYQKLVMKKIQRDISKKHWTNQPNRGPKDQMDSMARNGWGTIWIGLDMNDWIRLDQLEKFEGIQYVDVTPK